MRKITRHVKKVQQELERTLESDGLKRDLKKVEREARRVKDQLFSLNHLRVIKRDDLDVTIVENVIVNNVEEMRNKEKTIEFLKVGIQELVGKIEEQWNKIYDAYLHCVSEPEKKELLDKLIKTHVGLAKFKRQAKSSTNYDEQCEEYEEIISDLRTKLRKELDKEKMNEIRSILTECEEIANRQLELESKFNAWLLLADNQSQLFQIKNYITQTITNQGNLIMNSSMSLICSSIEQKTISQSITDVVGNVQTRDFNPQVSEYQQLQQEQPPK